MKCVKQLICVSSLQAASQNPASTAMVSAIPKLNINDRFTLSQVESSSDIVENGLLVKHLRQDVRSRILSLTGRRVVQLEPRSANGHRSRPAAERRPRRPPRRREELRRRQLQRLRSGGLLGRKYCPLILS